MKNLLCLLLMLTLAACGNDETLSTYRLDTLTLEGSTNNPIVLGQAIIIVFDQSASQIDYTLELNEDQRTYKTFGSYTTTTAVRNSPTAPPMIDMWDGISFNGSYDENSEEIIVDDILYHLSFSGSDLNGTETTSILEKVGEDKLFQTQQFVANGEFGLAQYKVTALWLKK